MGWNDGASLDPLTYVQFRVINHWRVLKRYNSHTEKQKFCNANDFEKKSRIWEFYDLGKDVEKIVVF